MKFCFTLCMGWVSLCARRLKTTAAAQAACVAGQPRGGWVGQVHRITGLAGRSGAGKGQQTNDKGVKEGEHAGDACRG